ncbi:MAG: hypothetical protein ACREL3_14130 [Gemmatimonadales bacterium]
MIDQIRWDQDPERDEALARILRAGDIAIPHLDSDWDRLRLEIMRRAAGGGARAGDWWEFIAQWSRVAAAASIAAMLCSFFLLWRAISASPVPESLAVAPESVAIARVATAYPDESAFASLVRTEHHDEFTTWGVR